MKTHCKNCGKWLGEPCRDSLCGHCRKPKPLRFEDFTAEEKLAYVFGVNDLKSNILTLLDESERDAGYESATMKVLRKAVPVIATALGNQPPSSSRN